MRHEADTLALPDLAAALEARVQQVRERRDKVIERGKRRSYRIPGLLLGAALRLLSFVWYTLNLDLRWVGMPRDPFGSVAITNVGSLGLDDEHADAHVLAPPGPVPPQQHIGVRVAAQRVRGGLGHQVRDGEALARARAVTLHVRERPLHA